MIFNALRRKFFIRCIGKFKKERIIIDAIGSIVVVRNEDYLSLLQNEIKELDMMPLAPCGTGGKAIYFSSIYSSIANGSKIVTSALAKDIYNNYEELDNASIFSIPCTPKGNLYSMRNGFLGSGKYYLGEYEIVAQSFKAWTERLSKENKLEHNKSLDSDAHFARTG